MKSTSDTAGIAEYLPAELRRAAPEITTIAVGWSGAGVYLVKTDTAVFVLKITADSAPVEVRRRRLRVLQRAADAGVAPCVVHIDEQRCAVLTEFVQDHSFGSYYGNPATRDAAVVRLAHTLRTTHAMDCSDVDPAPDPAAQLDAVWQDLKTRGATPAFVGETVEWIRAMPVPVRTHALVLSHNDVNPSNIVYDGERIVLLDWDASGVGDPYYDLAAASVFFRMDDATCSALIAAHDGTRTDGVPARFRYNRCIVAALCGTTFMQLARIAGYSGPVEPEPLLSLGEVYGMMRAGGFDARSPEGQWQFGLALLGEAEQHASAMPPT
jgi:aminoglycoside phosphotransferase (APT) family kinase protein